MPPLPQDVMGAPTTTAGQIIALMALKWLVFRSEEKMCGSSRGTGTTEASGGGNSGVA